MLDDTSKVVYGKERCIFLTTDSIVLLRSLQWSEYNFQSMATKTPVCRIEPGEKYDITEELPPMPLKELHRYIKDRYPQCVKVLRGSLIATPAKNAKAGVIVPGK